MARFVQLEDVKLIDTHASGIPESEFDPSEYQTGWSVIPLGPEGPIQSEDSDDVLDISDGFGVVIVFEFHHESELSVDSSAVEEVVEVEADGDERLQIVGAFLLSYQIREDAQPQPIERPVEVAASDVLAFARFNATLNAWPYWREFVQSMTGRMGLPTVTVPILPVPDLVSRASGQE